MPRNRCIFLSFNTNNMYPVWTCCRCFTGQRPGGGKVKPDAMAADEKTELNQPTMPMTRSITFEGIMANV